ncbi:MAG: hypothetical protein IPO15_18485 [Anaerolineae bacterium]|uniref:hypothetical protein n=1 Tax=Candidatus Amarolinea dominans TaxID=3140696 RepID=UPI0031358C42|nr:hypothetical protein [Anaerolineae bacterium]
MARLSLFIVGYAGGLTALLVQLAASRVDLVGARPAPPDAAAADRRRARYLENICLLAVVATMPSAGPLSLLAGVFASVKLHWLG